MIKHFETIDDTAVFEISAPAKNIEQAIGERIITLIPVPYAGTEKTSIVVIPPVDSFMTHKPA